MSVSAQYADYAGATIGAGSAEPSYPSPISNSDESETISTSQVGVQGCPSNYPYECGGKCWTCGSGWVVSCYNNQPYCCQSSYPNYCGKTSSCWVDQTQCNNAIQCNGQWWACTPTSAIPSCVNNQVYCCLSDTPYYWDGQCRQCPSDKPKLCVSTCYSGNECTDSNYPNTNCKSDGQLICCQSGFPVYCERTGGNCWKSSTECDNAQKCGSEGWTVCGDSNFPSWNCKPDGKSICCPTDKPYYVNGECRKCPADKPKQCGNTCYSDSACESGKVAICDKDNIVKCCPSDWPYYCPKSDTCAKDSNNCDALKKCGGEGWTYCPSTSNPYWNCRSDGVSRCCPTGYPYLWSSDWLCHTNQEQQKCAVPDGSSASCTCFSNSDCPASKPYCEQNYPSPISDGFDACLASPPEYCGNGNCGSGEDYKNCAADCGSLAPKGTINVDVYYSSGAYANKPISGAYVYLDSIQKSTTGSDGKLNFEAGYGSRTVKVECPDNAFCSEKSVGVDGTEYVSFRCDCKSSVSFSNLRARFKAKTNAYPKGYPIANVDVLIDNSLKGASNQFGAVDVEGLATGNHRIDVYLMVLEDGQEKRYIGGTSVTLTNQYEEKVYVLVKGSSPSTTYVALENGNEAFSLYETNVTPELIWIPIIIAVVWVAGTAWDAYDYEKCVERQANAWDPNKEDWSKFKCNTEMDEEQLNDCVTKLLSKNQNTIEGCGFEVAMLALNALPQESIPKTGIKLAAKIGKAVRIIPFIDDAVKGAYRTYRFVKGSEHFVTVTDKLNKGAKYVFKLADNSLKIFDNAVGFIVNKIARNPDAWKKISEKVDNLLLNAKPSDIPAPKLGSVRNIQGVLGEKAKDEYVAVVKAALEKEGTSVAIEKGTAKATISRFANSQKYIVEYSDTGTGINIFHKTAQGGRGVPAGEIDGLAFINGKPVIIEAKAANAGNIAKNLGKKEFFDSKVGPIEELTGQTPEVLLLIPKGEASKSTGFLKPTLGGKIDELSTYLENKGSHLAYDEFPVGVDDFEKSARSINKKAMSAINQQVGKYINSQDSGYAIHGVERFLNNDFDLLTLPIIFSAEKKAQFVVALGKNAESFQISKKALSKIEFVKPTMEQTLTHFDEVDGVIRLMDNQNPDNLIAVVLPHELAHAKIFDEFGALTSKVAGVPEGNVYDVLEDFFEISANKKALKHTANKVAFIEGIKKTPLLTSDLTSSNVQDLLKTGDFGQVASVRSLANRLGLKDKVDLIDDALSKTKYSDTVKGDAKKLFDLYDEYADFEGVTSEAVLEGRMSVLYYKTLDLAAKGAIQ
ncbi:hypothetical protein HYY73_04125 [Candidatus Woesearchaeota archaeon]|nr:hypothetical protein [Candidatus Woesearchaeota archaeon]